MFKKVLVFLKDCDKVKLEGVVTALDQKTFDCISCVLCWRQGTDWTCLAHPTAEKTSVTRAVESDRQKWATGKLLEKWLFCNYTDWEQWEVAERFPLKTNRGFTWFMEGKRAGAGSVLQVLNVLPCWGTAFGHQWLLQTSLTLWAERSSGNGPCQLRERIIKLLILTSTLWKTGKREKRFAPFSRTRNMFTQTKTGLLPNLF